MASTIPDATNKTSDTVIDINYSNDNQIKEKVSLLQQWSSVTGWHGISDAYLARSYWRWMWIVVVIFSMILGINQCTSMIMDFVDEDRWTTSISSKLASDLPVPTLLVCSLNIYNLSAVRKKNITIDQLLKNAYSNANVPEDILVKNQIVEDHTTSPVTVKPIIHDAFPQQNGLFPHDYQNGQLGLGHGILPGSQMGYGGQAGVNQAGFAHMQPQMQNVLGAGPQQSMGVAQPGSLGVQQSVGIGAPQPGALGVGPQQSMGIGVQNGGFGGQPGGIMGPQTGMGIAPQHPVAQAGQQSMGVGPQQGFGAGMQPGMGNMGQQSMAGGGFPGAGQGVGQGIGGTVGNFGAGRIKRQTNQSSSNKSKTPKPSKLQPGVQSTLRPSSIVEQEQAEEEVFAGMENSTFDCEATVVSCGAGSDLTWSNETVLAIDKCCHVTAKKDEDFCFTVNLTHPFRNMLNDDGQIHTASSENTVFILMNPRLDQYVGALISGERPGKGFRLYFGVGYDAKYYSKPILIQPGTYSLIELTLEEIRTVLQRERGFTNFVMLKPPCIVGTNVTYKWVTQPQYEKWACEADCHIQREMVLCGCTTLEGDFRPDNIYCANVSVRTYCKKLITRERNKPDSPYHRCKRQCVEACDWKSISAVVSTTTFPAPAKIERLRHFLRTAGHNYTVDEVKDLSLIEIYYASMFIRLTERSERATINELISNIGGALGVYAGISLITIYQVFVYLFMACIDAMFKKQ